MPDLPAFEVATKLQGVPSTDTSKSGRSEYHVQSAAKVPSGSNPTSYGDAGERNENPSLSRC